MTATTIVFDRSLGIRRNTHRAARRISSGQLQCAVAGDVRRPTGVCKISFMNSSAAAAPLVIRAKPGLAPFKPKLPTARGAQVATRWRHRPHASASARYQDREIVYFLNDPQTSSFSLYHDYTESRPGVKHYFNVVRPAAACRTRRRRSSTLARC